MNLEETAPTPEATEQTPAAPEPLPDLPIADHEDEFPTLTRTERAAAAREARASAHSPAAAGTDDAPSSEAQADSDARDEKGRFRHRARSQRASAADVPRINELTAKLRATEAERDALKAGRSSTPPASVLPPHVQQAQTPPAPVTTQAFSTPAPAFKDFLAKLAPHETYDDAVQRHAEAVADWRWQRGQHDQAQQATQKEFYNTFKARTDDAAKAYPDFQAVALDAESKIPPGSFIDSWVWEHPTGAHVLYHLQKNQDEIARIHALPPFEQLSELSLLGQRLSQPRTVAATTGSAPAPVAVTPAPRPPNPVRTGPVKAADEPPGDNASMAEHERFYHKPRRRP